MASRGLASARVGADGGSYADTIDPKHVRSRCVSWLTKVHQAAGTTSAAKGASAGSADAAAATRAVLAIPDASLIALQRAFDAHDQDHSGSLDLDELFALLEETHGKTGHPVTREEAIGALALVDTSQDGHVQLGELTDLMRELRLAREAFAFLDADGNGVISKHELRVLLVGELGFKADTADQLFAAAMKAQDGHLPAPAVLKETPDAGLDLEQFSALWWTIRTGQAQTVGTTGTVSSVTMMRESDHKLGGWLHLASQVGVLDAESLVVPAHGTAGHHTHRNPLMRLALAGTSCAVATVFTNPVDTIKTAMQLQTQGGGKGMFATTASMVRNGGVLTLWAGLGPAIARAYSYSAIRLGGYEPAKTLVGADEDPTLARRILAGCISGGVAAFAANPIETIKVQQQAGAGAARGSAVQAPVGAMIRTLGLRGLFAGTVPHVMRGAAITSSQLATYDTVKQALTDSGVPSGLPLQLGSSLVAGLVTTTCASPFDVVKTVVMDGSRHGGVSVGGAIRGIWAVDGARGFFRGWLPAYSRLGPHTTLMLLVYEQLRNAVGWEQV